MLAAGMKEGRSPAVLSSEEWGQPLPVGSETRRTGGPKALSHPLSLTFRPGTPLCLVHMAQTGWISASHLTALHAQGESRLHSPHLPRCVHTSGWFPSLLTSLLPAAQLPSLSCSSPSEPSGLHLRGHEHFLLLKEDKMNIRRGEMDAWVGNRKET